MELHPIIQQSFEIIDHEFGSHQFSSEEYAVIRRVIHSSADFDFKRLLVFSRDSIDLSLDYLSRGLPIITDVTMVAQGIRSMVNQTFHNPVISALDLVEMIPPNATRTETGILNALEQYPEALYLIGNAPTALIALCRWIDQHADAKIPAVVIGAPVGFVSVVESKEMLMQTKVPQIVVQGRKGGSAVASGIMNALLHLAWEKYSLESKV